MSLTLYCGKKQTLVSERLIAYYDHMHNHLQLDQSAGLACLPEAPVSTVGAAILNAVD
jgi:hypothetical protein